MSCLRLNTTMHVPMTNIVVIDMMIVTRVMWYIRSTLSISVSHYFMNYFEKKSELVMMFLMFMLSYIFAWLERV